MLSSPQSESEKGSEASVTTEESSGKTMARTCIVEQSQSASQTSAAVADSGKPKRPMNAFLTWARTERRRLHGLLPGRMANSEISKILGQKWKLMPEALKAPYYLRASEASDEYHSSNPRRRRRRCHKIDGPPPAGPSKSLSPDMMARLLNFNEESPVSSAANPNSVSSVQSEEFGHETPQGLEPRVTQPATEGDNFFFQSTPSAAKAVSPTESGGSGDSLLNDFDMLLTPDLNRQSFKSPVASTADTQIEQPPSYSVCASNDLAVPASVYEQPASGWPVASAQHSNIIQKLLMRPDQLPLQPPSPAMRMKVVTPASSTGPISSGSTAEQPNEVAIQSAASSQRVIMLNSPSLVPNRIYDDAGTTNVTFASQYFPPGMATMTNGVPQSFSLHPNGVNSNPSLLAWPTATDAVPNFPLCSTTVLDKAIDMSDASTGLFFPGLAPGL